MFYVIAEKAMLAVSHFHYYFWYLFWFTCLFIQYFENGWVIFQTFKTERKVNFPVT